MANLRTFLIVAMSLALIHAAGIGWGCDSSGGSGSDDDSDGPGSNDDDDAAEDRVRAFVRGDPYPKLVMEVDFVPGWAPRESVMDDLTAVFAGILDKPGGVEWALDGTLAAVGEDHVWTFDELDAVAETSRDMVVAEDTARLHLLFVDGAYETPATGGAILGLAWGHRHAAIFKQVVEERCASILPTPALNERLCATAEFSVTQHELGHLIGLVDNGLPMVTPHEDAEHEHHDASDQCVMYWAFENASAIDVLRDRILGGDESLPEFDAACLNDIAAVRDAED